MLDYTELSLQDWGQWLKDQGEREFHARQILDWIYQKGILSWPEMSNLSKELREKLIAHFRLPMLEMVGVEELGDGESYKFSWRLRDKRIIESVLNCAKKKRTAYISTQIGTPVRYAFSPLGDAFVRNLRPAEIVEQVLQINKWLQPKGEKVTHVVYGGMGEPLKNYEPVIQSIQLLSRHDLCNIAQRRITLATVGLVDGIKRLSKDGMKINLVLSLHAPNQHMRKKLIPYAKKYTMEEIFGSIEDYAKKTNATITFDYVLLEGINDHPDHALELARQLKGKHCTINLIPFIPTPGIKFKRPANKAIKQFRSVLYGNHIANTCQSSKGVDIAEEIGE